MDTDLFTHQDKVVYFFYVWFKKKKQLLSLYEIFQQFITEIIVRIFSKDYIACKRVYVDKIAVFTFDKCFPLFDSVIIKITLKATIYVQNDVKNPMTFR